MSNCIIEDDERRQFKTSCVHDAASFLYQINELEARMINLEQGKLQIVHENNMLKQRSIEQIEYIGALQGEVISLREENAVFKEELKYIKEENVVFKEELTLLKEQVKHLGKALQTVQRYLIQRDPEAAEKLKSA